MLLYGGVYVDADLAALNPLPIRPEDDGVSGLGCWSVHTRPITREWKREINEGERKNEKEREEREAHT